MKKNEVPQDESFLSKNNLSELYYVVDEDGHFTTEQSSGWEPKTIMQTETLRVLQQRVEKAKEKVKQGKVSPIVYYMELNKMDWPTLAAYMHKWSFFIKRHAKPNVFNRLNDSVLSKYAEVFGITLEELKKSMEKNKEIPFVHHQSAHCETGVASNLLKNRGLDISEAMVFGIGSGLFFVYLPFLKVNHAPAISYRPMPGRIFTCLAKRLGLKIERKKFRSEEEAQKLLDQKIAENIPCGLQVGVYNLPYFPDEYRFHFNAHNLVIYGKKEDHYLVSDPVLNHPTELSAKDLEKVRFAKGVLAPKGHMYYLTEIATHIDWDKAIRKAIQKTCNEMLAPVPIAGVRGMRWLAKDIRKWPKKIGNVKTNYYLAQIVRMQEEIGTGGGGFRYLFAVFLQESSEKIQQPILDDFSKEMIAIGNQWRDFALQASRVYKKRSQLEEVYNTLADELLVLANKEEDFFKRLKKALK